MFDEPIEVCDYCGKILEIDHIGPDGSRYMSCPMCDIKPITKLIEPYLDDPCPDCGGEMLLDHLEGYKYGICPKCDADPEFGTCGHPLLEFSDGMKICPQCVAELKLAVADTQERQTDLGIEIRDCAFLWDIGIYVDDDLLKSLRLNRRLQECGGINAIQK